MNKIYHLAVDCMGFENNPSHAVKAAKKFVKNKNDLHIILVGDENILRKYLKSDNEKLSIHHTSDIVKMDDHPLSGLRKTKSSMYVATKLVAEKKADAVLTAGSTSCFVPLVYNLLKPIEGINKPCFMPYLPTVNKIGLNMLDVGANLYCTGQDLFQFAIMGSLYAKIIRNIAYPSVGLINIGTEKFKGYPYHQEADQLLSQSKMFNYQGYVETRDLLLGNTNIAVCDGFVGNIALKSMEGGLKVFKKVFLKSYLMPWNWLNALLSIPMLLAIKKRFDYRNNAGALIIGLNYPAIKTHGSADMKQFYSSIRLMYDVVKKDFVNQLKETIKQNGIK